MSAWAQRRPGSMMLAGVAVLGIALAGCSSSGNPHHDAGQPIQKTPTSQPTEPAQTTKSPEGVLPATLTSSVTSTAGVAVDTPVSVTAANGTLKSVVLRDADGTRLAGRFNKAHTTWTATGFLDPDVGYTLQSTATNPEGKTTHSTREFTTEALTLDQQTYPNITPLQGSVMGIGMPVIVRFDVPVTDRAEMQKYMSVTSTPQQSGSWHWISSTEVHWRPRTYWQPRTHVHVDLAVNGVNAGNGIYGQLDRHIDFTIGRSVLIKADVSTDMMHVFVGGKLARTIPITGGKPDGFETRSGIKVISEKFLSRRMNSATVGIDPNSPDGYNIADVQFAMRVTNTGEFLHAAPWSVYAQGHDNVSHGCVGMSIANAKWLFGLAEVGTPVETTGSSRSIEPGNGWTDWDQTWTQYQAASAL